MKRIVPAILLLSFLAAISVSKERDILDGPKDGPGAPPKSVYAQSWALLIAIDKYENVPELKYAVADAKAMKQYLAADGGFPAENIETLYDEKATMANIKTALGNTLPQKVGPNDRVLIFFAGHGQDMPLPSGEKMGYLIPVEGKADNLYGTCLSMSTIQETAKMMKSKHIFYIVDACYSGIAGVETRAVPYADPTLYLTKLTTQRAVQIITAGQANETVIEGPQFGGGHSMFTYTLLSGLKRGNADLNGDGIIPASELYSYMAPRITRDSGGRQTPKLFNIAGDGEFVFFTEPTGKPAEIPLASAANSGLPPAGMGRSPAGEREIELFYNEVLAGNIRAVKELTSGYVGLTNVKFKLEHIPDLPNEDSKIVVAPNYTPLHLAAIHDKVEVAQFLIGQGADIESKNDTGTTPLHMAAIGGSYRIAKMLIEKGADVNASNDGKYTPLHWAARRGYKDIAALLLDNGADINARTAHDNTPLHWAANMGHTEIVALLLDRGCEVNIRNSDRKTPLKLAEKKGHERAAKLIEDHGGEK